VARSDNLAELDDETLVHLARRSHPEAFATLVGRHQDGIHWLVCRMIGPYECEDFTQEVFVRAYQALADFRGESLFRTWVYRIARNLCVGELRRRNRRGEEVSWDEEGEGRSPDLAVARPSSPDAEHEREEIARRVRALVDRLPVQQRTALTLRYLDELPYEEIAEVMGIPLGTVKTHIHRGRLRLMEWVMADRSLARGD
jgi:RNA polymerase sigma-70 factor (ECF subfamily)